MKLGHPFKSYARINSKGIKDFNIRCDTIKVLNENMGKEILDIPHSNIFADISPRAKEIKDKINGTTSN